MVKKKTCTFGKDLYLWYRLVGMAYTCTYILIYLYTYTYGIYLYLWYRLLLMVLWNLMNPEGRLIPVFQKVFIPT